MLAYKKNAVPNDTRQRFSIAHVGFAVALSERELTHGELHQQRLDQRTDDEQPAELYFEFHAGKHDLVECFVFELFEFLWQSHAVGKAGHDEKVRPIRHILDNDDCDQNVGSTIIASKVSENLLRHNDRERPSADARVVCSVSEIIHGEHCRRDAT